jgi:hypothetical protein
MMAMGLIEGGLSQQHNPQLPSWCLDWNLPELCTPISRMPDVAAGKIGGLLRPRIYMNGSISVDVLGLPLQVVQVVTVNIALFWVEYHDMTTKGFAP